MKYDDIIDLPHHESKSHIRMNRIDRAAQFAPFAALTGYAEAINEAGRLVDSKKELTDDEKEEINYRLKFLLENTNLNLEVMIIYFVPDKNKNGGSNHSIKGIIRKVDIDGTIHLKNRIRINIDNIISINSSIFDA